MRRMPAAMIAASVVLAAVACGGDEATPDAGNPVQTVRDTERERIEALVARDMDTARDLHADDFRLTTPAGETMSKEEYLDAVESGRLDYVVWEPISPIIVEVLGERAVVRYRSKIGFAGNFGGTTEQSHVDTYEQRDGRWQIVRSVTN